MKLYIDIDGVLLGAINNIPALAEDIEGFLEFALANFDCYWLTTHCKDDATQAVDYLRPYCDEEVLGLIQQIKATNFKTFKTEALSGDFIWLDDSPTAFEIKFLEENDWLHRWFELNTRDKLDDLINLVPILKQILRNGFVD